MTEEPTSRPSFPISRWTPIIVMVIAHTVTIVWWAAKLDVGQKSLEKDMGLLVDSVKEIRDEQKSRIKLLYSVESHGKQLESVEKRLMALENRYRSPLKP